MGVEDGRTRVVRWLDYWRQSLADGDRVEPRVGRETPIVSLEDLDAGRLDGDLTRDLFEAETRRRRAKKSGDDRAERENEVASLDLLVAPLRAVSTVEHGVGRSRLPRIVHPLWVPARLEVDGRLDVPDGEVPWIPRQLLAPVARREPVLGTVDGLDQATSLFDLDGETAEIADWDGYWSRCRQLFEQVTGQPPDRFELPRYEVVGEGPVAQGAISGAARHVLGLYDDLRDRLVAEDERPPVLVERLATGTALEQPADPPVGWHRLHLGQMTDRFPLAPSQRLALERALVLDSGEILPVTGPPGTGKTTLLQSVVASLWVQAAVEGGEPPIVVATSANNQAVTNIIESFDAGESESEDPLARRWIAGLSSYGAYAASSSRSATTAYQTVPIKGLGFDGALLGAAAERGEGAPLETLRDEFLEHCSRWAGERIESAHDGVDRLQGALVETVEEIRSLLAAVEEIERAEGTLLEIAAHGSVEAARDTARTTLEQKRERLEGENARLRAWREHCTTRPVWMDLLAVLPPIRQRIAASNALFWERHGGAGVRPPYPFGDSARLTQAFERATEQAWREAEEAERALTEIEEASDRLVRARRDLRRAIRGSRVIEDLTGLDIHWRGRELTNWLTECLDPTLRYRAFLLAGRYWEGRWLLERHEEEQGGYRESLYPSKVVKRRRRDAKLAPCLVSTFYMIPRFFTGWTGEPVRLVDTIDLLIVDEAGQVSTELAAASFALARRALVVGDVHQIEPVRTLGEVADRANFLAAGLDGGDDGGEGYEAAAERGVLASAGSLMAATGHGVERTVDGTLPAGFLLTEHRRCLPEIIEYSNRLAYQGLLEPKRPSIPVEASPLPPLGFAHVPGTAQRSRTSWTNPMEAEVIARWLADRRGELEKAYDAPLAELAGVVTPFAAQAGAIESALARHDITGLTVGTVHRLQGAERHVVLFSPTYDRRHPGPYFFDQGVNMLNVATSRARDSFLVFGEMGLFDPDAPSRPSGLLARMLFERPEWEITDIELPADQLFGKGRPVTRLQGHAEHSRELRGAFETARTRLVVVSPWLTVKALEAEQVPCHVTAATARGIEVVVYSDRSLVRKIRSGRRAAERLREAGARVVLCQRIHNKTLCRDGSMMIEGSFNWFSASRDPDLPWYRYESSLRFEGREAEAMVDSLLEELESRAVKTISHEVPPTS